jgi:hypothetical protein
MIPVIKLERHDFEASFGKNLPVMKATSSVSFVLTNLMDVNNERVKLYKSLVDRSTDLQLKLLFMQYAIQAQTFMATLNKWGIEYGVHPHPKKKHILAGAWRQLQSLFLHGGRNVLLAQCELMEQNALRVYKVVVGMTFLPMGTIADVTRQVEELERSAGALKSVITGGTSKWAMAFT